jgi:hypothetical protein
MVVFMVLFSIQLAFTIASLVVAVVNFARAVAAAENADDLIGNVLDFIWFVISTALNLILWISVSCGLSTFAVPCTLLLLLLARVPTSTTLNQLKLNY